METKDVSRPVRTRMAPSPTGNLHLGTAYATLWPFLLARKNNGHFILRIEDTDTDRSTQEFAENILQGLKWLHLDWDEGPEYQMKRLYLYQQATDRLLKADKAYLCFCTKEELDVERKQQIANHQPQIYSGKCRSLTPKEIEERKSKGMPYVVRLKMPEDRGTITFHDMIHGEIAFEANLIGDMVIMRQNGIPLYNFAVVVDDLDMEISHILRGDDHISNTPKQIVLFEALGTTPPQFAHYPMILNQDRHGKLSKRTGSTSVDEYKQEGYLPEALINYLALLGWHPPGEQEVLTFDELIQLFDVKNMNKSAAAWNAEKLDWINGEYIRKMTDEELTKRLQEYLVDHPAMDKIAHVVPLIKERIKKLADFVPLTHFLFNEPEYDISVFDSLKLADAKAVLIQIKEKLTAMSKPWDAKVFEQTFRQMATELQIPTSSMFQLIRVAVAGQLVSPPLFECMQFIGEDTILARIDRLINNFDTLATESFNPTL